jgi:hypothetical protein
MVVLHRCFLRKYSANKDLRLVLATTPRPSFPTSSLPLLSTQHQPQWSVLTRAFHMRNGAYMRSGNCLQARISPQLLTQPTEAFQPYQGDKTRAPTKLLNLRKQTATTQARITYHLLSAFLNLHFSPIRAPDPKRPAKDARQRTKQTN